MNSFLLKKGDIDAALGTFFDSFGKIIIAIDILVFTFHLSRQDILSKIVAATGITVFIFSIFTFLFALHTAKHSQNHSITSLFAGISGTTFFVWLNAVMLPVYFMSKDAVFAWRVTLAVSMIYALIQVFLAFFAEKLFAYIPVESLRSAVIGGCFAWMLLSPIGSAFAYPWVIVPTLFILLSFFFGNIQLKFLSPTVIAIIIGSMIALVSGVSQRQELQYTINDIGFYFPSLQVQYFAPGVLQQAFTFLPLIIAFALSEVTSNMQAFKEAAMQGDDYPVKTALLFLAIFNLIGALIGNPFLLNYYWGHTAWKKVQAGPMYSLLSGGLHLIICLSGLAGMIAVLIPTSVSMVMLIFIGMVSGAAAFSASERKYYPAMLLGATIPIFELINNNMLSIFSALQEITKQTNSIEFLYSIGYSRGYTFLAQGSMIIAILYTSMLIMMIDHAWKKAAVFSVITAVSTFFGLIHADHISINANQTMTMTYLCLAAFFMFIYLFDKKKKLIRKNK